MAKAWDRYTFMSTEDIKVVRLAKWTNDKCSIRYIYM